MTVIQIIAVIFSSFAWSRAILRYKDRKISSKEFIFWSIIWIGVVLVAFIPETASFLSELVGIKRPIDVIVYLSIVLLFYLIFRIYVKLDSINSEITKIVRELSLRKK